MFEALVLIFA